MKNNDYWFKRRRYGYGWFPVSWQGWTVFGVYLLLVIAGALMIMDVSPEDEAREVAFYLLFVAVLTVCLITITMKKAPKAKWRWGKSDSDNPDEDY